MTCRFAAGTVPRVWLWQSSSARRVREAHSCYYEKVPMSTPERAGFKSPAGSRRTATPCSRRCPTAMSRPCVFSCCRRDLQAPTSPQRDHAGARRPGLAAARRQRRSTMGAVNGPHCAGGGSTAAAGNQDGYGRDHQGVLRDAAQGICPSIASLPAGRARPSPATGCPSAPRDSLTATSATATGPTRVRSTASPRRREYRPGRPGHET